MRGVSGTGIMLCVAAGALCLGSAAGLEAADAAGGPAPPSVLKVVTAGATSDGTYVGSDATPAVSVEATEAGGTVTLYSDASCSVAISAPANVPGGDSPYMVHVETDAGLAAGLHHIHASHTKSQQTSECSAGTAYRVIQPMTATYRVTFTGAFTTDALAAGVGVPGGAHFTTLIGSVHNQGVSFWERGGTASAGTESMAETGGTGTLRSEVVAAGQDSADVIQQSFSGGGTAKTDFEITVSGEHASVTLASMLAPSPDWFVGVSGLPLLGADGHWAHQVKADLFPYDAGTENGERFSLNNDATTPQETITSLRDTGLFYGDPVATLQFERVALVSNLAQESGQGTLFFGHNPDAASQGFRTGPNPSGYTLNSVVASFGAKAGSPGDIRVRIAADDGGSPGEIVGVLNGNNPDAAGLYAFVPDGVILASDSSHPGIVLPVQVVVPDGGISLNADTDYHVVFDVAEPVPGNAYRLAFTGSDAEDAGSAPGWSIADVLRGHIHDTSRDNSWKISIQGETAPP